MTPTWKMACRNLEYAEKMSGAQASLFADLGSAADTAPTDSDPSDAVALQNSTLQESES